MTDFSSLFRTFEIEAKHHRKKPNPVRAEIVHGAPATNNEIDKAEHDLGVTLPQEVRDYYLTANGSRFDGEEILPLDELQVDDGILIMHSWGNGDFTGCLLEPTGTRKTDEPENPGYVYFLNHSPDQIVLINDSIGGLLVSWAREIFARDEIAHPIDYINGHAKPPGCYSVVIDVLRGGTSELAELIK